MPTYTPQDIRSIRKRLRLTQQEFGQLLGCSAKTVSSWESGYRNPSGTARTAITQLARRRQAPKRRHRPGTTYTSIHQWANGRLVARYSNSTEAAQAIAPTRPETSTTTIKHGILTTLRGQQHTAYEYQWTTNNQLPRHRGNNQ